VEEGVACIAVEAACVAGVELSTPSVAGASPGGDSLALSRPPDAHRVHLPSPREPLLLRGCGFVLGLGGLLLAAPAATKRGHLCPA